MRNEESLKSMSRGRGGMEGKHKCAVVQHGFCDHHCSEGRGAKPYVDGLQTLRHQHPFG